ncbi:MAG: HXXEE domain-containing protein [Alsobacter sp.]
MDLTHWLWLATAAYAIHMLEEFVLNWRDWARAVIKLPVDWSDFYVTNGIVVVLGITAANLAVAAPAIALAFPALMVINALVFHIAQVVRTRGRFSPGVMTAVILFLPVAFGCYRAAAEEGVLNAESLIVSTITGALLMASPIVLLHIRNLPYFIQKP